MRISVDVCVAAPYGLPIADSLDRFILTYWLRSGNQGNGEARIKAADYYYYGRGTSVDYKMAASLYETASHVDKNSLARWNLGWMFENGLGVARSLSLAKFWYSEALSVNTDAFIPVMLASYKLFLIYLWDIIMLRPVENPRFLDETLSSLFTGMNVQRPEPHDPKDDGWEIGKDGENLQKWRKDAITGEDNAIEEQENEGYGPPVDGNLAGEESSFDGFLIIAVSLAVAWMVYVRQFRQQNENVVHQHNAEPRQFQQEARPEASDRQHQPNSPLRQRFAHEVLDSDDEN